MKQNLDLATYAKKITEGDRTYLSKAITLVESDKPEHQQFAASLIEKLLPMTGDSIRIGVSGTPGVGKSTFIEAFGKFLINNKHKIAVLAIDPSSQQTGGSILGDKTRMQELSVEEDAFIRPSPSRGALGGVAAKTREAIFLCEAAGYDIIIVETVGVGQSEVLVSEMVDLFLLLMQPGAGDELQGIKRGILEVADIIAVNKADGDQKMVAKAAQQDLNNALHILRHDDDIPYVGLISALKSVGIDELWQQVEKLKAQRWNDGAWKDKREEQRLKWLWNVIDYRFKQYLYDEKGMGELMSQVEHKVVSGDMSVLNAAKKILNEIIK